MKNVQWMLTCPVRQVRCVIQVVFVNVNMVMFRIVMDIVLCQMVSTFMDIVLSGLRADISSL